jgi:hypothetical protein
MVLHLFDRLFFFLSLISTTCKESSFDKVHQKGAHIADALNHSLEEGMIEFVSLGVGDCLILPLLRETVGRCCDQIDHEPDHQQPLLLSGVHNY